MTGAPRLTRGGALLPPGELVQEQLGFAFSVMGSGGCAKGGGAQPARRNHQSAGQVTSAPRSTAAPLRVLRAREMGQTGPAPYQAGPEGTGVSLGTL